MGPGAWCCSWISSTDFDKPSLPNPLSQQGRRSFLAGQVGAVREPPPTFHGSGSIEPFTEVLLKSDFLSLQLPVVFCNPVPPSGTGGELF